MQCVRRTRGADRHVAIYCDGSIRLEVEVKVYGPLASPTRKTILLKTYWNIPDRQVDTSVVLANPPLDEAIE